MNRCSKCGASMLNTGGGACNCYYVEPSLTPLSPFPAENKNIKKAGDFQEIGIKDDNSKLRWDLLPIEAVEEIVKVLTYGATKYSDDNWKKVNPFVERYEAAALRHYAEWKKGNQIDTESGLNHLAHAATNILFLIWESKNKKGGGEG